MGHYDAHVAQSCILSAQRLSEKLRIAEGRHVQKYFSLSSFYLPLTLIDSTNIEFYTSLFCFLVSKILQSFAIKAR